MKRDNAIVFVGAWLDACALWRMYMPHVDMPGSSFFVFGGRPDFNKIAGNDVCIVQRCCTREQFEFLKVLKQLDIRIVYDLDDNMWSIPEFNPAYATLSRHRDGFVACMQLVDVVSVSTRELKRVVEHHMKKAQTGRSVPVVVAENRINEKLFAAPKKKDRVIVGWAGSSSHKGDLEIIVPALTAAVPDYPATTFEFRGMAAPESLRGYSNVTFKLWTPVAEFASRMPMWGWSVALAPLVQHEFNDAKSCIKMIEAAYCSVPCLASWVAPYDRFCSFDSELRWLLCASSSAWGAKLRTLLNEQERREELGQRAFQVMRNHFSFESRQHEGWNSILSLARGVGTTQGVPVALRAG